MHLWGRKRGEASWESWLHPLVAAMLVPSLACTAPRVVRLDTGSEQLSFKPGAEEAKPVHLRPRELQTAVELLAPGLRLSTRPQEAARRLFQLDPRSGYYRYEIRSQRLIPEDASAVAPELLAAEAEVVHHYLLWCERTQRPGDFLNLLEGEPALSGESKYVLAMAIAQGSVRGEVEEALRGMTNPEAVISAVLWTMTLYMLLWTVPEPVSKGIAATLTVALIAYVGVDTVWSLIGGWRVLVEEADRATSFAEICDAGQRYGKIMGQNVARVFVMLAMAAIGSTAADFAARLRMLPGSAPAALRAGAQVGIRLPALAEVSAVAVSAGSLTLALVPGAVAMNARQPAGGSRTEEHHIATNKNEISSARGGPWTPRFRKIFTKAGMNLDAGENRVPILDHKGPHTERYHRLVYEALDEATSGCRSINQCRAALIDALEELARQIATPGTELNQLVTRGMP